MNVDLSLKTIPLLRVSGTHRAAGEQIGAGCADALQRTLARNRARPPAGCTWDDLRDAVGPYRAATRAALPWLADELDGCAAGSGIDPLDLWVLGVEEIWRHPPLGKCSDFAAGPPATFDGGIWLAHNNDLGADVEEELTAIVWELPDQPPLFSVGVGPYISVGFNAAGLSLTGNEVSPNDDRLGVPRLLIVRDILAQRTSAAAIAAALRPERASSYNNLIAHQDGTIVNVEGSATDYALIPAEDGWTVHTNHYVAPRMLPYEGDGDYAQRSGVRYARARELMQTRSGAVTPELLKTFLSDHAGAPYSLCRHVGNVQTVFWCVIDLQHLAIEYGRGQPCAGAGQHFTFKETT